MGVTSGEMVRYKQLKSILKTKEMKEVKMKNYALVLILSIGIALSGCAVMSDTEQRTLSGAAIGTAAGTAVGAIAGNAVWGAAIGAAAGAAGGYLYDPNEKSKEAAGVSSPATAGGGLGSPGGLGESGVSS